MADCTHHWKIDTPTPGKDRMPGVCKLCGATGSWKKNTYDYTRMDWVTVRRRDDHGSHIPEWLGEK